MQFLTPLFWIGALVVSVPIFLHLTRRQTKRPIPFSSLMFLRRIPVQEIRRRKLRNPLLLLLRCLLLMLLVAAFARPVVDAWWADGAGSERSRSVAILLDGSLSMNRDGVWPAALEAVDETISGLRDGDEARLIRFGTRTEVLTAWETDRDLLQQVSAGLEPSFEATSYGEALRMAVRSLEEARNHGKEIVLITDLQAVGLDLDQVSDILIPEEVTVRIEDVGRDSSNLFIDNVRLERKVFQETYPHSVVVRISQGEGLASVEDRAEVEGEVLLYLEGVLIDRKAYHLEGGGVTTVTFDPFEVPEVTSRGKLVLEPSDALAPDDTYFFVLEPSDPFEVRLFGSSAARELFFVNALASGGNLPFTVSSGDRPPAWEDERVVVLNSSRLPEPARIEAFLERGGGIIFALGDQIEAEAYNRTLTGILPAELVEKRYARSHGSPFVSVTEVSSEHPIFLPFRDLEEKALSGVQFFGYWQVEPAEGSQVLARFNTGEPALIEKKVGAGTVLLFVSSLDRVWSDFPLRNAYVPFWQQMVLYASDWKPQPAAQTVNQVLGLEGVVDMPGAAEARDWDLLDPEGKRLVTLGEESPAFIPLERPGYYEIRHERRTNWVAVNTDRSESDLTRVSAEELRVALESQKLQPQVINSQEEVAPQDSEPVWWLLLAAAALLILVESFVANRSRRRVYA